MNYPAREAAWKQAQDLERQGRFKEAESLIQQTMPEGVCQQTAHLYELRMQRLLSEGDRPGAIKAYQLACEWWWSYASGATSGGEGMARSYERNQEALRLAKIIGERPPDWVND